MDTYRNDLDAAHARIDALEHQTRRLADENAKLRAGHDVHPPEAPTKPAPSTSQIRTRERSSDDTFNGVTFFLGMLWIAAMIAVRAC